MRRRAGDVPQVGVVAWQRFGRPFGAHSDHVCRIPCRVQGCPVSGVQFQKRPRAGFTHLEETLASGRFDGAVHTCVMELPPARARAPLTVPAVKALEVLRRHACGTSEEVNKSELTDQEAPFAGAFLFCLFGRVRYGDLSRVVIKPEFATCVRSTFPESTTVRKRTKTGQSLCKASEVLPRVAPSVGLLAGSTWAEIYVSARSWGKMRLRMAASSGYHRQEVCRARDAWTPDKPTRISTESSVA